MHTFIVVDFGDIYTLDNAAEIAIARARMLEAGIASLPVFEGPAGEEGTPTGETLEAVTEAGEVPTDHELAAMLMALVNPQYGDDERAEIFEQLGALGPMEVRDFRGAGVLTNNAGFVLSIGSTSFQISVVS
jgi:hypothetical protein